MRGNIIRLLPLWARSSIISLSLVGLAHAAGLNDTGIANCYSSPVVEYRNGEFQVTQEARIVSSDEAKDEGTYPRQDCRNGRDAAAAMTGALKKTGGGGKGFDFTKISNSGDPVGETAVLGNGPNEWACTRDNVTGLLWEVKPLSGGRRLTDTFTWYSSDAATNGGQVGSVGASVTCSTGGQCNTEAYVNYVKAQRLCGYTDWRLPTRKELVSIVDFGQFYPSSDPTYFELTMPIPVCSLSAVPIPNSLDYRLTANCSPEAFSYIWTDAKCLDARYNSGSEKSNTCVVTPQQTTVDNPTGTSTTYYVLGVNAAGSTGAEASTTLRLPDNGGPYKVAWADHPIPPNPFFWSATAGGGGYASITWGVNFNRGRAELFSKYDAGFVRLVR
jgi:hypothetical protein